MFTEVNQLIGKTLKSVERTQENALDDEILFTYEDGSVYKMFHSQDCCESVYIEDICGDLSDLVGAPITMAEEVVSDGTPEEREKYESVTWTYYKFATIKGYVTIRWCGSSNGYYSESVSFCKVEVL